MSEIYYKIIVSGRPNPTDEDIAACSSVRIDLENSQYGDDFFDDFFSGIRAMIVELTQTYNEELIKRKILEIDTLREKLNVLR